MVTSVNLFTDVSGSRILKFQNVDYQTHNRKVGDSAYSGLHLITEMSTFSPVVNKASPFTMVITIGFSKHRCG